MGEKYPVRRALQNQLQLTSSSSRLEVEFVDIQKFEPGDLQVSFMLNAFVHRKIWLMKFYPTCKIIPLVGKNMW